MENELLLKQKQEKKYNAIFGLSIVAGIYLVAMFVHSIINLVNMFSKKVKLPQYPGLNYYVAFLNIIMAIITIYLIVKMAKYHLRKEYIWGISIFVNTLIVAIVNYGANYYLYNFKSLGGPILQIVMILLAILGMFVFLIKIKVESNHKVDNK